MHLHALPHGSFLYLLSLQESAEPFLGCITLMSAFAISSSLILTLLPRFLTYKDLCDYLERTQIIQNNLLTSDSVTLSYLPSPFCHLRSCVTGSRDQDADLLARGHYSVYHTVLRFYDM